MQRTLSSKESNPVCDDREQVLVGGLPLPKPTLTEYVTLEESIKQDEAWREGLGVDPQYCRVVHEGEALRFNQGKTPYGNLPLDLLDGAARVMGKGEVKYGRANYRKGYEDLLSPYHSLLRHVAALQPALEQNLLDQGGPLYDEESGEAHIHHVITSALILIQALRKKGVRV